MLFNEPKLLKCSAVTKSSGLNESFSALQRAEIAEMVHPTGERVDVRGFSALQRAEIAEMLRRARSAYRSPSFSALQRAEIAEILPNRA